MTSSAGQDDVITFLSTPTAYGRREPVERIDTHISIVWLAGDRAYKLKRAVRFSYVDFSTVELRRLACEAELRLNRRTAPSLYLGIRPVTRDADGTLALDGRGEAVDWLVEMVRFDQETLFDRLAEQQRLDIGLMDRLADAIASMHAKARPRPDRGGSQGMAWVIDGNAEGFAQQDASVLDPVACGRLTGEARVHLARHRKHLDDRGRRGLVRECHGDLHLRNICLVDSVPTLFDAVEFNDNISCIDVAYDLAFLVMDLWRRRLHTHANRVFNGYVFRTGDTESLALLPLFLSCRAGVRAMTSATAAGVQADDVQRGSLRAAAREYLTFAEELLRPHSPSLIAVGGFSGSGKSTLARDIAPAVGAVPGALVLRSDEIRKARLGVDPLAHVAADGYAEEISAQVYRELVDRARVAVKAGHAVIADAVFARPSDRAAVESAARELEVPFVGLWIDAPRDVLVKRLRERSADASDATSAVLDQQIRAGAGSPGWSRVDGSQDASLVRTAAWRILTESAAASSLTSL